MEAVVFIVLLMLAAPIIISVGGLVLGLLGGAFGLFASLVTIPFALLGAFGRLLVPFILLMVIAGMLGL